MKIFQVECNESLFVVIAETESAAKKIVTKEYFDDEVEVGSIQVTASRDLREGIIIHYDYEDIYWQT